MYSRIAIVFCSNIFFLPSINAAARVASDKAQHETSPMEEVVVSASRVPITAVEAGPSATILEQKHLQQSGARSVKDALESLHGLSAPQSGPAGGATSLFIRGAKSEHTLVLMDGVEMNNPSAPSRGADLSRLSINDVERIEVLRGPQSVLHGSNAIGGVVNIVTRKPAREREASASIMGGPYETLEIRGYFGHRQDEFYAAINAGHFETEGMSAASEKDGNREADGHRNVAGDVRIGWEATEWDVDFYHRSRLARTDIDTFGGPGGDDPNYTQDTSENLTSLTLQAGKTGFYRPRLLLSYGSFQEAFKNEEDPQHPGESLKGEYLSTRYKTDWQNQFFINEQHTVALGIDAKEESARIQSESISGFGTSIEDIPRKNEQIIGVYLQETWRPLSSLTWNVGVRQDTFGKGDKATTFRSGLRYQFEPTMTSFFASFGTGFNAPSLYQRHSQFGDENLESETSRSWDAGVEQELGHMTLAVTYFENRFSNLIDFDLTTSRFGNIASARTHGVETLAAWRFCEGCLAQGSYTKLEAKDLESSRPLPRRAADSFHLQAGYEMAQQFHVLLGVNGVGRRWEGNQWVKRYQVAHLASSYQVDDRWQVFTRIDNLFDETYADIPGYGTMGRAGYFGGKMVL